MKLEGGLDILISNLAKIESLLYASGDQGITLRQIAQRTALSVAAVRQLVEKSSKIHH